MSLDPLPQVAQDTAEDGSSTAVHFYKLACDPAYRGRGIGSALMHHLFTVAREEYKATSAWCEARMHVVEWYERLGMKMFGEVHFGVTRNCIGMKIKL